MTVAGCMQAAWGLLPRQAAAAVEPAPQASGYTVTGHVVCGDTQRPARFAQVMLIPATQDEGGGFGRGRRLSTRTDLDGSFSVNGVPAGDYYVTGQVSGYINKAAQVESALNAGGDVSAAVAGVPEVHVGAGGGSAQLTLQRGGVIAGTVTWDDGSPASGVQVSAQAAPVNATSSTSPSQMTAPGQGRALGFVGGFSGTQTDDRGNFRVSGLAPGSYIVRTNVQAPAPQRSGDSGFARMLNLSVYAPDKVRRTDAATLTLAAGEERDDVAITLGLAGLHSVSGTVSSTSAAVRSGSVSLTDQTDSTLNRTGTINADGSFVVPYVPAGNYTMRVSASANLAYGRGGFGSGGGSSVQFQPLQVPVTVSDSDVTGLALTVVPTSSSQ